MVIFLILELLYAAGADGAMIKKKKKKEKETMVLPSNRIHAFTSVLWL
jgi:hypothetical protein